MNFVIVLNCLRKKLVFVECLTQIILEEKIEMTIKGTADEVLLIVEHLNGT